MKKAIFLLCAFCVLLGCNSERQMQNDWITTYLPEHLWNDITFEAVSEEWDRLTDEFVEMGNDAITAFNEKGEEDDLSTMTAAYLFGLGDLYALGGGNASEVRKREAAVDKYQEHFSDVTEQLADALGNCLHLKDSTLKSVRVPSDSELFRILIGTPDNIAQVDESIIYKYARLITIHEISELDRPVVASCEYSKDRDLWIVRLDNMDNQYVKFYVRNDGDYDIEYSSKLNADGTPKTDTKVTVPVSDDDAHLPNFLRHRNASNDKTNSNVATEQKGQS